MTNKIDPVQAAGLVEREIRTGERDGKATKIAVARRTFRAERSDVWDALTNTDRIPRWFLPVNGELKVGGHYQLEGNAGGTVESCDAPASFAVTWEFGGQVSWLQVYLNEAETGTTLELVHEAYVDPELWEQFGPGAVGLGWDGALYGLGMHIITGEPNDAAEFEAWAVTDEGKQFFRVGAEGWARAAIADGDDEATARAAAERSMAFYTTPSEGVPDSQ